MVNMRRSLMTKYTCEHSGVEFESKKDNPWISVKDKLPPCNEEVLTTDGKSRAICWVDIGSHDYLFMVNLRQQFIGVTHWMPLPELPNYKDNQIE